MDGVIYSFEGLAGVFAAMDQAVAGHTPDRLAVRTRAGSSIRAPFWNKRMWMVLLPPA